MSDEWVSKEVKEALKSGDVGLFSDVAALDYDDAEYLMSYYQSVGKDAEDEEEFSRLLARAQGREANRAVERGSIGRLAAFVGKSKSNSINMADWNEYEKIKDMIRDEPKVTDLTNNVFQAVIYSSAVPPTGRGKSNSAYTFSEMFKTVDPNLTTITNNESDPFETLPQYWEDVEERIREIDGQILLIIDEAAQFLQYADQTAGMSVSKMLKLLRKHNSNIIFIGHTGMDIPADIRRQMFFIDKISQKEAVVGYGIEPSKDGTMKVANRLFKLDNIPETSVDYDDIGDEGIEIKFGEKDDEDEEEEDVGKNSKELIEEISNNTCKDCSNAVWNGLPFCYAHARKYISEGDYDAFDLSEDELDELQEELE